MKRKSIRPGRLFWVGTFAVGVFSPGKGKRRVNDKMLWMAAQYKAVQGENKALKEELATAYAELDRRTPGGDRLKKCQGEIAECPVHGDHAETVQLPRADPGVVFVHHMSGTAEATSLPGAGTSANGS